VVYNNISSANFEQKKLDLEKARMSTVNILISNLPELKCSTLTVTEVSCVDKYKVEGFRRIMNPDDPRYDSSSKIYESLLRDTVVELRIVNVAGPDPEPIILYDDAIEDYSSMTPVYNPVSYYDPLTKKASFAMLVTTFYER
jgi:hypothetical protein